MKNSLGASIFLAVFLCASLAQATLLTYNYTGDNIVTSFLLYDSQGNKVYDFLQANGPDNGNWEEAASASQQLALTPGGTYTLEWEILNFGDNDTNNPIALLADYSIDGAKFFYSDSSWFAGATSANKQGATVYGANGADNLWLQNLNHPVEGISTNASWIGFGPYPGLETSMYVSTSFTAPDVLPPDFPVATPEPCTMLLVGLGLTGVGFLRKRSACQSL